VDGFSVVNNKMRMSSGEESINESIKLILNTNFGERLLRPKFGAGLNSLVFSENNISLATIMTEMIEEALELWEPRIEVQNVSVAPDESEGNKLFINIEYTVITSNNKRNLVFPFYLQGAE